MISVLKAKLVNNQRTTGGELTLTVYSEDARELVAFLGAFPAISETALPRPSVRFQLYADTAEQH